MSTDYKSTVFLPRTGFPMKADLPGREPRILASWRQHDLFARLRQASKDRPKFILHDGPPYANGHLHIGHALNKILKDMINRSRQMMGFDAHYVPGWDCHGLPIEWKVEERHREAGRDKEAVSKLDFRKECRDFAQAWIGVQSEEFQRLGVMGDWARPYTTMAHEAEATIVAELGRFLLNGSLYRGEKPVMWSVVEKTALADAEVEYHDHTSTTIYVRFPVATTDLPLLQMRTKNGVASGAAIPIWTTTPWTIPGSRAVAYGSDIDYAIIDVERQNSKIDTLVVAKDLLETFAAAAGIEGYTVIAEIKGADLRRTVCHHPLWQQGYGDFDVPLLPGDHVTTDQGTGFVHTAPGHGEEDFVVGQAHGLPVPRTVDADGRFYEHVPLFAGKHVFKVDGDVAAALDKAGNLLARGTLVHSYPHSWRSKAPLIYRTTPQWFIAIDDANAIRAKALDAIADTAFYPETGRNRIRAMVEQRPDWCVSRQRAWGVPIAVFVDRKSGAPLRDPAVMARIVDAFRHDGADAWFRGDPLRFLEPDHDPAAYDAVTDILDVWFDSGATHSFVLEGRGDLAWPATLYLEGTDQHRGWFQSSLLESCGTRGRAPYQAVLTHGFVLDEGGLKMSKSRGGGTSPQDVVKDHGADVLRLWVAMSDYREDLRIGPEIVKQHADYYRRLRNTLRYLLGALDGFHDGERVDLDDMPELERWVLHRLVEIDALMRKSFAEYDFHSFYQTLHNFAAVDLSAFYFDIRKDSLYCDSPSSPRRRAVRTTFDLVFDYLVRWIAPALCFTAEEAWRARHGEGADSVHLTLFKDVPATWRDDDLAAKWETIRGVRRVVTGALERERAEKRLGSSLQAAPRVYVGPAERLALRGLDLAEIAITSAITVEDGAPPAGAYALADVPRVGAVPAMADGHKCGRCWRVLPEVAEDGALCGRCAEAVAHIGGAA